MKKYHDQVIRNMHAEALTSAALPARFYVDGFKNLNHVVDVGNNDQNTTVPDLLALTNGFIAIFSTRTPKQLRVPEAFHEFVLETMSTFRNLLEMSTPQLALKSISRELYHLYDDWGYDAQYDALHKYEQEHPLPGKWYDKDNTDPEYQAAWKAYFDFRKTIRFNLFWTIHRFFAALVRQLRVVINETANK